MKRKMFCNNYSCSFHLLGDIIVLMLKIKLRALGNNRELSFPLILMIFINEIKNNLSNIKDGKDSKVSIFYRLLI